MPEGVAAPEDSIFSDDSDNIVYIVMTRACDLLRKKAVRAMLMAGTCKPVDAKSVDLVKSGPRTAVLLKGGDNRFLVDWHCENILTLAPDQLTDLLSTGGAALLGRLRESAALPLQQVLLSSLGKIGEMAPLPSTFPAKVRVFVPDTDGQLILLKIGDNNEFDALCWVGRDGTKPIARLPFNAEVMFPFIDAVKKLDAINVHSKSIDKIMHCKDPETIDFLFSKGIPLNISSTSAINWKAPLSSGEKILGKVVVNNDAVGSIPSAQNILKAGLVFEVKVTTH